MNKIGIVGCFIFLWLISFQSYSQSLWEMEIETDPIFDTKDVYITDNQLGVDHQLLFRCMGGMTDLMIFWDGNLVDSDGFYGSVTVVYRINQNEPVEMNWNADVQGQISFYPSSAENFILEIISTLEENPNSTFAARAIGATAWLTGVWNLDGLLEHFNELREACNW